MNRLHIYMYALVALSNSLCIKRMTVARKQVAKSNHLAAICLPMICLSIHPSSINFYGFARAAVTQTEWLHNRNALSHSSWGQRSEIKVWAGLAPSEAGKENLFLTPGFWRLAGGLWRPLACRHITLAPAFVARWLYQRVLLCPGSPVL